MADGTSIFPVEREAHRAAVNIVLVRSLALAIVYAGRTIANVGCALSLRELETAVAALVQGARGRSIPHLHTLFDFPLGSGARIRGTALAAAVCGLASLTCTCFFVEVRAFEHDKARRAVEADLANQIWMIHGGGFPSGGSVLQFYTF
jgi:succinate dehydrogenase hydrophobic anchor subunit